MLPKLNNKKMYGFARNDYESKMAKALLDVKDHDGFTNPAGARLVRTYNDYLQDAKSFIIHASVIFLFMKSMYYGSVENPVVERYCQAVDRAVIGRAMGNVMRMTRSVASQRKLMRGIKNTIKKNMITQDWDDILSGQIAQAKERLARLRATVIPANLYYTPLGVYSKYLQESGRTIFQDIDDFVGTSGTIFDDEQIVQPYFDHVLEVMSQIPAEEFEALIGDALKELDRQIGLKAQMRQMKKDDEDASFQQSLEQCQQDVLALCSRAEKVFVHVKNLYMARLKDSHTSVWVVCASRVNTPYLGYLSSNGKRGWRVSASPKRARVFLDKEEAERAVDDFRSKGAGCIAETAEIEIAKYEY